MNVVLLAIAALAMQPAPPPASSLPPPQGQDMTVIERETEAEVPLNSRIARSVEREFAPDALAVMYLREWSDCVVMMNRARSVALLATPLNSPEQSVILNQLTGHRFTRRTVCARFRTMRVDNLVLRGAIAEALARWEERRRRSAGPLDAAAPPAAAGGRAAVLAQMGRCVVERDPDGAERIMATRPGSRASRQALAAISDRIDACLPPTLRARRIHPLTLRGAIGEPYYLRKRNREAGPLSSAGAAQPGS
ncbi:MAG TPA: hypothetical protein VF577_05785 [Allosphingosinicella sp.]